MQSPARYNHSMDTREMGTKPLSEDSVVAVHESRPAAGGLHSRWSYGLLFALLLVGLFARPLFSLIGFAAGSSLDSYILLVPAIVVYLLNLQRKEWPPVASSPAWAIAPAVVGLISLFWVWYLRSAGLPLSLNDFLTFTILAFVSFCIAGGFLFLGKRWMMGAAFPVGFLIFLVPLPEAAVKSLETASEWASAEAADIFFGLTGTPELRDGVDFQLPNINIRVAQECSGIHSSLVLFITSLIVSHLLLRTTWRRAVLVALVIPLGILRNGFRILVIGWLCVHIGPQMIDHPIHHRGGPVFFVLSLIPLFLLLLGLRRGEQKRSAPAPLSD